MIMHQENSVRPCIHTHSITDNACYAFGSLRCFLKNIKSFEEGDIEVSIIDPDIEIIMHSTGGAIDPDLWMKRITAVVLSDICGKH